MDYTIIAAILVAHFLGDFVFQTGWMANRKSFSWRSMGVHIFVYSLFLLPFGPWYAIVNALFHLATDIVSSNITSGLWKKEKIRLFFTVIGADQMLHYLALFGTYQYCAGW